MNQDNLFKNKYLLTGGGVLTASVSLLAVIGLAFALSFTKSIMIPFVLSLFLFFTLSPLKTFFVQRLKLPNWLALIAMFTFVVLILMVVFFILFSAIQEFASGYRSYEAKAVFLVDTIQQELVSRGVPIESFNISETFRSLPFGEIVKGAGRSVLKLTTSTFLVFIFLIFLFTGGGTPSKQDGEEVRKLDLGIGREIYSQMRKYLAVKFTASFITATLVFLVLSALGLDLAFLFALLVFILNFIPTVGSMVSTVLPLPVAFFQYDEITPIVLVLVIPGTIQFLIGNILEPKFMGQRLNMHPITVLLALMFWGLIWGIAGAFLAVPLTVVVKAAVTKIEGGNFIAKIMAGSITDPTSEKST